MIILVCFDGFSNVELQLSGIRIQYWLIDCRADAISRTSDETMPADLPKFLNDNSNPE